MKKLSFVTLQSSIQISKAGLFLWNKKSKPLRRVLLLVFFYCELVLLVI
jgi:hypothetical protein